MSRFLAARKPRLDFDARLRTERSTEAFWFALALAGAVLAAAYLAGGVP